MIEVREVRTRCERREFLEFPNKLYKGCPYYVPPLFIDEKKIFRKDYVYYDTCEAVYFNAYKDGEMAGRISGIIQGASNEKWGQKRVRFTRFETIRDFEVAKALFDAVEKWALDRGMEEACGPMGFSDFEREGLLTDGFDQMSTFEEAYNYDYYPEFIERLGYVMETEWEESQIRLSKDPGQLEEMEKMAAFVLKRYKLHLGPSRNGKDFLRKYADGFFEIVDKSYDKIYGTVPFTEGMKKMAMDNFALILDNKHAGVVLDENNKVIALGLCFPGSFRLGLCLLRHGYRAIHGITIGGCGDFGRTFCHSTHLTGFIYGGHIGLVAAPLAVLCAGHGQHGGVDGEHGRLPGQSGGLGENGLEVQGERFVEVRDVAAEREVNADDGRHAARLRPRHIRHLQHRRVDRRLFRAGGRV